MERDNKRLAYQGKIEALLKEWGSQIDQLQERADATTENLIADLNTKRQEVRSKLADMKAMGDDNWQTIQASLDQAVADMHRVIDDIRERLS